MRFTAIFVLLLFCAFGGYSQKSKNKKSEPAPAVTADQSSDEVLNDIYWMAVELGDYEVAKNTLMHLLALHPERVDYLDSLSRIYYAMGAYPQSLLCANKYLSHDADNEGMLEIKAASEQSLNLLKESLISYEKLYKLSNNVFHAYQIAVIQYNLKRLGECIGTIGLLSANPETEKAEIHISYHQSKGQKVPMRAALENLRGVINMDLNLNEKAKENFEEALKIAPEFELAKGNLASVSEETEEGSESKE